MEARLRHWTPRRPSAKLKERIFQPAPQPAAEKDSPGWSWLVPVAATFVFSVAALTSPHLETARTEAHAATRLMADNQSWVNHASAAEVNVLSAVFEWTNAGQPRPSIGALLLYNTNGLKY